MTQETLPLAFAVDVPPAEPAIPDDVPATPPVAFADPEDAALWLAGLPYETRVDGQRVCRHHGFAIRGRGAPCLLCVKAGVDPSASE